MIKTLQNYFLNDKAKVINLRNLPKLQILKQTLHVTYPLKLLDKMCKYAMNMLKIQNRHDSGHIEANIKWPLFWPWHFQMHFLEGKLVMLKWNLIEILEEKRVKTLMIAYWRQQCQLYALRLMPYISTAWTYLLNYGIASPTTEVERCHLYEVFG